MHRPTLLRRPRSAARGRHASHAEPLWYVGMTAWLLLTAFAVNGLLTSGRAPPLIVVALAGVAVHSAVFGWLALTREPGVHSNALPVPPGAIALLAVIGLSLALLSPSASIFFAVSGAVGALYLPPRQAATWIVAGTAIAVPVHLQNGSWVNAVGDSVQFAAIMFFCYGWARLEETNAALAAAREQVGRLAVADERVRFSRDLHDLLGHTLSVIRIKSELAARLAREDPRRAGEEMAEVERVSRAALAEVRQAVSGYRADLVAELDNARRALRGAGIDISVEGSGAGVEGRTGETLAWVLREAVTNVLRHAKARRCEIRLTAAGGHAVLVVRDDGVGGTSTNGSGSGLRSISERVGEAGGLLEVASERGRGTQLRVSLPAEAP